MFVRKSWIFNPLFCKVVYSFVKVTGHRSKLFVYLQLKNIKDNNIERLTVKNYFEYPPLTINEQQNRIEIMKALNMSKIEEQEEETKQRTIYHN